MIKANSRNICENIVNGGGVITPKISKSPLVLKTNPRLWRRGGESHAPLDPPPVGLYQKAVCAELVSFPYNRYRNGLKGHRKAVILGLIRQYLLVENQFNQGLFPIFFTRIDSFKETLSLTFINNIYSSYVIPMLNKYLSNF